MIVVDSSVWIDYLNGRKTRGTMLLNGFFDTDEVCLGDIILLEVLQGIRNDNDFMAVNLMFDTFTIFDMLGESIAVQAAKNYRNLRRKGSTVRKSADIIIGTYCIESGLRLLHSDSDFNLMEKYLGLKTIR